MVEFLSDEWIAALANACNGASTRREPDTHGLVVEPVVRGAPGRSEVRYRVSLHDDWCSVTAVAPDFSPADVCLETDYATAVALSRGDVNAQAALAEGRLRVSGDVARLAAHAAALSRLDDLFAAVRAVTTYTDVERGA